MKILLTNIHLKIIGGSEIWTLLMAKELKRRKNEVYILAKDVGEFFNYFQFAKPYHGEKVDLALVNHALGFEDIRADFIIQTSHSPSIAIEAFTNKADKYVAISEEIALRRSKFNPIVIRNPIDTKLYKSKKNISVVPTTLLFYSYYKSVAVEKVKSWCDELGISFLSLNDITLNQSKIMNDADIVMSVGRGALEGLCSGRVVIAADHRDYMPALGGSGLITAKTLKFGLRDNFTGRSKFAPLTREYFRFCLDNYKSDNALTEYVRDEFSVETIVDKYLEIFKS